MSKIAVNEITDELGTGAPAFPNGMSVTGAALTDPQITGGIYLGGTGSANYLDDYEVGTWTPGFSNYSGTTSSKQGFYTKIGNTVIIWGGIVFDSNSDSSAVIIQSLPFTRFSVTLGTGGNGSIKGTGAISGIVGFNGGSSYEILLFQSTNNSLFTYSELSTKAIEFFATYQTESP